MNKVWCARQRGTFVPRLGGYRDGPTHLYDRRPHAVESAEQYYREMNPRQQPLSGELALSQTRGGPHSQ